MTMEANELMVGDWVMLTDPINNGERVQAKEIHGDGCITVDGAITKMFEPIPLTAEILGKNFSSTPDWYFIGTNKYCFRIYKYKDKWDLLFRRDGKGTRLYLKISYVHELQHALRLCGIEKEIEL